MAIRVYRVAVVGCPRAIISQEASQEVFQGVGKSCLCNRFVRPEAYSETEHSSIMDEESWIKNSVFNGDHFVYWGAANKHLHDGTKVRFQVVEHTEIYADPASNGGQLLALPSSQDYLARASSLHFQSRTPGKEAYRLKATDEATKRTRGPVRTRQLFPNEDFGGSGGKKNMGIYGYVCVFDPTLEEAQMQKQLSYLSSLLPLLKKRKLVIACVKCDLVDEMKIRFGANLAAYALKKAIPFVEVSARDSVNVDDAFYSLVSPPKKSKSSKSSGKRSSPYLTYHEVIESRKGDLNRAKDAYRKLLQRKVTEFSCQWIQIQPELVREPDYQAVVSLAAANEAPEELVKKMFQLRLIEIKLTEANRKFGSTVKKANKDRSSAQQIYLSEAMRSHPDLGTDSMYDYVYSPGHSIAGDTDTADTEEQLTEPSTPSSSYHPTPDLHGSVLSDLCDNGAPPPITNGQAPRPRSATIPDMLVTVPSYDTSALPPQSSNDNLLSPKMSSSLPRQPFSLPNEKEPPPLPPRDMGTLKKNKTTTQSQPFLENVVKQPGTLKREAEARRLSNSMDCLLLPEEDSENSQSGNSFNKLEAEPYLRPSDIKKVMGVSTQSSTITATTRNTSVFMSMRVSGRSRPQLPNFQNSTDGPDSMKRSKSFERGHKRSQSNPFTLDLLMDGAALPPELPPRNTEHPAPPVPARRSPQHRASRSPPPLPPPGASTITVEETFESSLEFGNPAGGGGGGGRISLPGGRVSRARSPQAIVRDLKEHTFKEVEEDNISMVSGPFEEIDLDRSSMVTEHSVNTGGMVRDSSSHTLPSQKQDDDENDQYARIEDITQQYIAMAPAPANVKGATLPAQRASYLSGDDLEEEGEGSGKRAKSMSQAAPPPTTPKKDPGVITRTMRRFRKQKTEPIVRESTDSPSPPPPNTSSNSISSSILASPNRHSLPRPLPPSPTKGVKGQILRKHSNNGSGSNIYETIDEDLLNRVINGRTRRQGSTKYDTVKQGLALPVDPAMWPKYLEVIHKFFSLPEIQTKWVEVVREVMPDEDAEDIPPPYYNTAAEASEKEEGGEAEKKITLSRIQSTSSHQDDDQIPVHVPAPSVSPLLQSTPSHMRNSPLVPSPHSPFQTPRHHHMMMKAVATSGGGGSPRPINSPVIVQRQASRDDLIEMMNQQLRHDDNSSDSETDSDEEAGMEEEEEEGGEASSDSDSTDYDSDAEDAPLPVNELPSGRAGLVALMDNRAMAMTPHTDLDEALGTHNSVSTDSDHIEADPVIKSPQSASVEGLDHTHEEGVGVVEDHCVLPSQFLSRLHQKQQSISETKTGAGGTRSLSDSGISNQNYEENNQSETEC